MSGVRRLLAFVALPVAALVLVASSPEENEARRAGDGGEASGGAGAEGQQTFAVGDLVELGDWQVQVHGVTDPFTSSNGFSQPAPGNRFVSADVEVFNHSDAPAPVSSILCFELQDGTNAAYQLSPAGFGPGTPAPPDGEVAPGAALRGTLAYELPAAATGLRIHFKCELFSTGSAVINLS
jgi:hypothetical protein